MLHDVCMVYGVRCTVYGVWCMMLSSFRRLDINAPLKVNNVSAETLEQAETFAEIQRAREVSIQCTIVKQMKTLAGKSMKHNILEGSVVSMLKFNPDSRMLKKQIQYLIEEKYMARVEGDTSSYIYIP